MNIAIYLCLGCMLGFSLLSVVNRNLIYSAISLAIVSVALGVMMYILGAHWAAIFEISVCSGLVTVIFISAVSLSNGDRLTGGKNSGEPPRSKIKLPIILISLGAVLMIAASLIGFSVGDPTVPLAGNFDVVFWETRQADIFGQMVAIIAGASAIVVFFKEERSE